MIFCRIPVAEAEGAILAHSVGAGGKRLSKGRVLTAQDIVELREGGLERVMAARLEPGDVAEDEAAARLARALSGDRVSATAAFTGRANLISGARGLVLVDKAAIDRVNSIDEALTVATLSPHAHVEPGQIVATIKIIPFAAPGAAVDEAERVAGDGGAAIGVAPFLRHDAALIMTTLDGAGDKVLEKTRATVAARLEALGSRLAEYRTCAHDEDALAAEIKALAARGLSPILVFGSSAIVDRRDVIPAAIERAGGVIDHFGMPVDPGNLLLLAHLGPTPVIGLPGCARSPKLNGFDWVLERIVAAVAIGRADIMAMGAGGLLKEFAGRPQPRGAATPDKAGARAPRIAAVVLAAGRSRRMGEINKLLERIEGEPMIARIVDAAGASRATPVIVVTGHQTSKIEAALTGRDVVFVHNPGYAAGLSTSLRAGLGAIPGDSDGAVVCLGDMPFIEAAHIDKLIAAFDPLEGRAICVPTFRGKHGNPVLWSRAYFPVMLELEGDVGAKHLIGDHANELCEVAVGEAAIFTDIDTPEALRAARDAE